MFTTPFLNNPIAMWVDKYANYESLKKHELEGRDYRIHLRIGPSRVAIVAPHGGGIERGTMELADAVAGMEHSFYGFEGIKSECYADLHITSDNFDEPQALAAVRQVNRVITIHGARGGERAVYAGGLDLELKTVILGALSAAGFFATDDPSPMRQGKGMRNICNRGLSGKGVQLELTLGLRKKMFADLNQPNAKIPTKLFEHFVSVLRDALARYAN